MKWIKIFISFLFSLILIIPMVLFNFEENAISEIDNRRLADNPFETEGRLKKNIDNYINDRIGLRNEMILGYTILNDKLFGMMSHPSYTYGQDGYVFGAGITVSNNFGEYHIAFANMVKNIQTYCEMQGVPFLFVFNPAKPAVYSEYIAKGINYNRSWVDSFFAELDKLGVRYIDNTKVLSKKKEEGETVFNKKFDANHWNALGAYYGTYAALAELNKDLPNINLLTKEQLIIEEQLETSLLVSKFPIHEMIPKISVKNQKINRELSGKLRAELKLNPSFAAFEYTRNEKAPDGAKALVFQGSYMNGHGYQYFANGFKEYILIHDYQNVIDFSYYYNIFRPECVIFEVAEYTFSEVYFNYQKMKDMQLTPAFNSLSEEEKANLNTSADYSVTPGNALTEIKCNAANARYVWMEMGGEYYDMKKTENGYEVTILTELYQIEKDTIKIHALSL